MLVTKLTDCLLTQHLPTYLDRDLRHRGSRLARRKERLAATRHAKLQPAAAAQQQRDGRRHDHGQQHRHGFRRVLFRRVLFRTYFPGANPCGGVAICLGPVLSGEADADAAARAGAGEVRAGNRVPEATDRGTGDGEAVVVVLEGLLDRNEAGRGCLVRVRVRVRVKVRVMVRVYG